MESWNLQLRSSRFRAPLLPLSDTTTPPGQVTFDLPPSSITWVLSAFKVQWFITIICVWQREIQKSSSVGNQSQDLLSPAVTRVLAPSPSAWREEVGEQPTSLVQMELAGSPSLGGPSSIKMPPFKADWTIHFPTLTLMHWGYLIWTSVGVIYHLCFSNFYFLFILSVPRDDKYKNLHSLEDKSKLWNPRKRTLKSNNIYIQILLQDGKSSATLKGYKVSLSGSTFLLKYIKISSKNTT